MHKLLILVLVLSSVFCDKIDLGQKIDLGKKEQADIIEGIIQQFFGEKDVGGDL